MASRRVWVGRMAVAIADVLGLEPTSLQFCRKHEAGQATPECTDRVPCCPEGEPAPRLQCRASVRQLGTGMRATPFSSWVGRCA